jgi:hypothetical protein
MSLYDAAPETGVVFVMQCRCGFRTFSTIDWTRHRHACHLYQAVPSPDQDAEFSGTYQGQGIPLRRIQPAVREIDMKNDDGTSELEFGADDAQERRKAVEEDILVLKVMTD